MGFSGHLPLVITYASMHRKFSYVALTPAGYCLPKYSTIAQSVIFESLFVITLYTLSAFSRSDKTRNEIFDISRAVELHFALVSYIRVKTHWEKGIIEDFIAFTCGLKACSFRYKTRSLSYVTFLGCCYIHRYQQFYHVPERTSAPKTRLKVMLKLIIMTFFVFFYKTKIKNWTWYRQRY